MNEQNKKPELFGLSPMDLRSPKPFWLRTVARLSNVIADLETELKRMKERNLPEDLIDAKDAQINELVEFYDATEAIIQSYEMIIKFNSINNKLNEIIYKQDTKEQQA
jgi:hypothetical protein